MNSTKRKRIVLVSSGTGILLALTVIAILLMLTSIPPPQKAQATIKQSKINEIARLIKSYNRDAERVYEIATAIYEASETYNVDRQLVIAIAIQESDFNYRAIGRAGEIGTMQIKPSTAKMFNERVSITELKTPMKHIALSVQYLAFNQNVVRAHADTYDELLILTATAFNRGHGVTRRLLKANIDPTNRYANEVMNLRNEILQGTLTD